MPELEIKINYTNGSNFIFDDEKIEFTGTLARFKDLRPINAIFHIDFSSASINWQNDSFNDASLSAATINAGFLNLQNGNSTCKFLGSTFSNFLNKGAIRILFKPGYMDKPSSETILFKVGQSANENDKIELKHDIAGAWILNMTDDIGASIIIDHSFGITSVDNTKTYEILLVFDLTVGKAELYIDENQQGLQKTFATTFTRSAANQIIINSIVGINFKVDELTLYDDSIHLEETVYTLIPISSTIYSTNPEPIKIKSPVIVDKINSLVSNVNTPTGSNIKYILAIGGPDLYKYHNGSTWADSDLSESQSNTLTEINDNLAALDLLTGITIRLVILLISDGNALPNITSSTLDYSYSILQTQQPACVIFGRVIDQANNNLQNAKIKFSKEVQTDANGFYSLSQIINPVEQVKVEIEYLEPGGKLIKHADIDILIPNQDESNMGTMTLILP